ncbi:hypothetical protein BSKO_00131 [Bryopsis sp. KO-2023]|nr:hypothetical protein BSKO_00131 [Bryopsis sp. KO-2023]
MKNDNGKDYKYLVEVGEAKTGESGTAITTPTYRYYLAKQGLETEYKGCSTLYDLFERSAAKYHDRPYHGHREINPETNAAGPFVWQSYSEVATIVKCLAKALSKVGCTKGSKIGIYGPNAPQWAQAMQACSQFSAICVPIYDSLAADAVEYIISHSEMDFAFCSDHNLASLVKGIGKVSPEECRLKGICAWGDASMLEKHPVKDVQSKEIRAWAWDELVSLGAELSEQEYPPKPPLPENTCTLMYTSGTTGTPKGVIITHRAMVAAVTGLLTFADSCEQITIDNEVLLSFLTLAHIYGRLIEETISATGGRIGYWQGDIRKVSEDISELRPTIFCGVPRVWERIHKKVMDRLDQLGYVARCIYEKALDWKYYYMQAGYKNPECSPILDCILFRGLIQRRLGGRVKFVISGAAPLAPHLEKFIRAALGTYAAQGYGLTETLGVGCICVPDEQDMIGMVGPVMPGLEIRLESVEEMGYNVNDPIPRGELCFRGPVTFSGYYKNKEAYDEVVDSEEFFHTGDIVELHPSGALKIVDRLKNIFKLSQGEYVAVEKVECALVGAETVGQLWVYGNSMRGCLVAVVVPDQKALCSELGIDASLAEVCEMEDAKEIVLKQLTEAASTAKLKGFEKVRGVILSSEEFTIENELLTPSYKMKRHMLLKAFQKEIDQLYEKIDGKA